MAVSNSIGSNVFDILVGLGLPWALKTLAINYGSDVSGSGWIFPATRGRTCHLVGFSFGGEDLTGSSFVHQAFASDLTSTVHNCFV